MHISNLLRLLPLLVIGTESVSAKAGLSMRRAGRPSSLGNTMNVVRAYDQCMGQCGQHFDGGVVNSGDQKTGMMMAVPTDLASPTGSRKTKPTACHRKSRRSRRPVSSTSTSAGQTPDTEVSQPTSTTDLEDPVKTTTSATQTVAKSAQISMATEIKAPVGTTTSTTKEEVASSTEQELNDQPTSSMQPASQSSTATVSTSLSAPETTEAASAGVGGPDRSKPEDWLKAHNDERAKYGAKPIVWNTEMASVAQAWGAQCTWAHSQGIYGENIAASIAADTDPVRTATGLWIGEAADYDYDNPVEEMVWKGLGEIGCAAVDCPASTAEDKKTIWTLMVCEYKLKPGATGSFVENVGRPMA